MHSEQQYVENLFIIIPPKNREPAMAKVQVEKFLTTKRGKV